MALKEFNVNLQIMFPDSWDNQDVIDFFAREWKLSNGELALLHVYSFDMESRRGKGANVDGS